MIGIDTCFLIDLYWEDSPRHSNALSLFKTKASDRDVELAVYYNCFNEFLHVITDAKRFVNPFTMQEALSVIDEWCSLDRLRVLYPDDSSLKRAITWLSMHKLGRNRINDTQMAAAYISNGVFSLITANPSDFMVFDLFDLVDYR
ncbi:MAG: hypothetical protein J6Y16_05925 [Treponema sp.]|nr:hypothetical protein [Treponema sp.]